MALKRYTRSNSLDILKGVAILLVIFTHSSFASKHRESFMFLFEFIIDMAIPIFMVISGYVNCISMDGNKLKDCYKARVIERKIARIVLPFFPCIIVSLVFWLFIEKVGVIKTLVYCFFQRWGAGGYYPIIMIQFILLFPLILSASRSIIGVVSIIVLDIVSELVFNLGGGLQGYIGSAFVWTHRICILRYLSFIIAGIFLYRYEDKIYFWHIGLMAIVGFCLVCVLNHKIKSEIIFGLWRTTSAMTVFWASSFVAVFIKVNSVVNHNCLPIRCLINVGKSTYSIFVVQAIWFFLIGKGFFTEPLFVVSILVCVILGLLYANIQEMMCRLYNNRQTLR